MRSHWYVTSFILFAALAVGCDRTPPMPSADAPTGTVTVIIEFEDADSTTLSLENIADGSTLETVMRTITDLPMEISGAGQSAFVQSIAEVATDASQGWTFKVDGEFANQGMGVTVLHPPTTVTWSYGEFDM